MRICLGDLNIDVKDTSMGFFFFFLEKFTSCAGFLGSELKIIFHWYAIREIALSSKFKYLADSLRSWKIGKSDVSLGNNLAMELSPSARSLIHIKNNRGPGMDP